MKLKEIFAQLKSDLAAEGIVEPLVFGDGDAHAAVMLVGEAPGKDEVLAGKPFVGKAGKNLNEFLARTSLDRQEVYITNVVKFRPYTVGKNGRKRNRPPTKTEILLCSQCLTAEIKALRPKTIVTLGNTALRAIAAEDYLIGQVHGQVIKSKEGIDVFALYHPASVIYNQSLRSTYQDDLDQLKAYLFKKT